MADFVASEKVPIVHYDLRPHIDREGEVPEPSWAKLNKLRKVLGQLTAKAARGIPDNVESLTVKESMEYVGKMLEQDQDEDREVVVKAIYELTQIPLVELRKLPPRIVQAFFGHLVQEYLRPEAPGTAATS